VFSFETTPDMVIADAVRISMSIPFLFVPHYRYVTHQYIA
jgi:predicted acylesterase/phospholipase RssA